MGPKSWTTSLVHGEPKDYGRLPHPAGSLRWKGMEGLRIFLSWDSWKYSESWCMLMYVDLIWFDLLWFLDFIKTNIRTNSKKYKRPFCRRWGTRRCCGQRGTQLAGFGVGLGMFVLSGVMLLYFYQTLGAPWTNSGTVEIPRRYKFWKMLARTSHPIVAHSWLFSSRVQTFKVESSKDVQRSGFVGCGKLWKTTILLPDIINITDVSCLLAEHFGRVEHEWWCSLRRNQDRLLSMLPPDVQNQIFASVTTLTSWTQFPKVQRPTPVHGIEGWCFQRNVSDPWEKSKCLLGRVQQKLIYIHLPVPQVKPLFTRWALATIHFFPWSCIIFLDGYCRHSLKIVDLHFGIVYY